MPVDREQEKVEWDDDIADEVSLLKEDYQFQLREAQRQHQTRVDMWRQSERERVNGLQIV